MMSGTRVSFDSRLATKARISSTAGKAKMCAISMTKPAARDSGRDQSTKVKESRHDIGSVQISIADFLPAPEEKRFPSGADENRTRRRDRLKIKSALPERRQLRGTGA
jgi:hypothetical protein